MTRTFRHTFEPLADSPVAGGLVELTVQQIEDAGLREVLQTPGALFGSWSILDALLHPTGDNTPFLFREALGQAREVKVALSGLFGRFVARAYLERYFSRSIFAHVVHRDMNISGFHQLKVEKRFNGDLPDWICCRPDGTELTIAEAKGCHDYGGPDKALARARVQAARVDITARGSPVRIKRFAIATRWGMITGGPHTAEIAVHDPEDGEVDFSKEEREHAYVGLMRMHIARLIAPLGHRSLASEILSLTAAPFLDADQGLVARARSALDGTSVSRVVAGSTDQPIDGLIGGAVTRSGVIPDRRISAADQGVLARLDMRPMFVGMERGVVHAAITGDAHALRSLLSGRRVRDEIARSDSSGGWIVPLGAQRSIVQTS